jgi:circadian clock protein KaiB
MKKESTSGIIEEDKLVLQLYVSGMSPKSVDAIQNIKKICDEYLKNAFELEIIDIYKNPELASKHSIVFSPSLIKLLPEPKRILIGTLQDTDKVLKALGINPKKSE